MRTGRRCDLPGGVPVSVKAKKKREYTDKWRAANRAKHLAARRKWRAANRLTPEGLAEVRKRVVGDVQQHIEMRARLLELGYLGPSSMWRSGSATLESYTP